MARPRIVIDWDDTCVDGVYPDTHGTWKPGAVEALLELAEHAELVVSTCRIAPVAVDGVTPQDEAETKRQIDAIRDQLDQAGLTVVGIWTKPFKPRAVAYIDDKAIRYSGNWEDIREELCKTISKSGSSEKEESPKKHLTPSR